MWSVYQKVHVPRYMYLDNLAACYWFDMNIIQALFFKSSGYEMLPHFIPESPATHPRQSGFSLTHTSR